MSMAADAILGVNFFSALAPGQFLKFDRAFVCMFRIAAGETWIDDLPVRALELSAGLHQSAL